MDVTRVTPRTARMATLGVGLTAGLVFALPVKTGSVGCPPAHEGRTYCLLQHAWAPAAVKLAAAIFVVWLLSELLQHRLPAMRRRWRGGERIGRHVTDRGRSAVLGDSVLAAASWGIVPEPGRALSWSRPEALLSPPAPAPTPEPAAAPAPAPAASPARAVRDGVVRALTSAERLARPSGSLAGHLRVLTAADTRTRRLRRASDPALVVSCWSDASAADSVPDDVVAPVSA